MTCWAGQHATTWGGSSGSARKPTAMERMGVPQAATLGGEGWHVGCYGPARTTECRKRNKLLVQAKITHKPKCETGLERRGAAC
eukprot:10895443-Karenia_brevis.AAC.1